MDASSFFGTQRIGNGGWRTLEPGHGFRSLREAGEARARAVQVHRAYWSNDWARWVMACEEQGATEEALPMEEELQRLHVLQTHMATLWDPVFVAPLMHQLMLHSDFVPKAWGQDYVDFVFCFVSDFMVQRCNDMGTPTFFGHCFERLKADAPRLLWHLQELKLPISFDASDPIMVALNALRCLAYDMPHYIDHHVTDGPSSETQWLEFDGDYFRLSASKPAGHHSPLLRTYFKRRRAMKKPRASSPPASWSSRFASFFRQQEPT